MPPVENNTNTIQPEQTPQVTQPTSTPPAPNSTKTGGSKIVMLVAVLILVAAVGVGGYLLGSKKSQSTKTSTTMQTTTPTTVPFTVPKDATVASDCVDMRGKQFILPKDIPDGPIYDMYNSKVVAIEYVVNFDEVTSTPQKFANLLPGGTFDHLTIMPMDAHAGVNVKHVHVIAYTIPAKDAEAIKCSSSGQPSNMSM